jgi:hypothetical protein
MSRGEKLTEAIKCVLASRITSPSVKKAAELLEELFPLNYSEALLSLKGQKRNKLDTSPKSE